MDDIFDILSKKGTTLDETVIISQEDLEDYILSMCKKAFALGIEYREDELPVLPENELTGRYFESKSVERRFYFFALPKLKSNERSN